MFEPIQRQEIEDRIKEIEADQSLPQMIAKRLSNPHSITSDTKTWYESSDTYWSRKAKSGITFPLSVEKSSLSRALRILDFLVKVMEARGHKFRKNENGFSVVQILDRELHFSMRNIGKYVENTESPYSFKDKVYTQDLCIQFYEDSWNRKEWKDTPYSKLEEKVIRVVAYAEVFAEHSCEYHKQIKEHWRLQRLEAEKIKENERLIAEEKSKVQELFETAQRYDRIKKVENYLLDRKYHCIKNDIYNDDEQKYFDWGMQQVKKNNPLYDLNKDPSSGH